MPSYGAVPLNDSERFEAGKELHLRIPKVLVSFLEGGKDATERTVVESRKLKFAISAESIRFIAYLFFWSMCGFAIAMTKIYVKPLLLKGDGSTCPPFQISHKQDGTVLHDKSNGFDYETHSHLQDAFGFGNVSKIRRLSQDGSLVEIASSN
jgi:hypothetical protein